MLELIKEKIALCLSVEIKKIDMIDFNTNTTITTYIISCKMDLVPKASIKSLTLGDVLTGQDGNKYVVCKKGDILYWEPYITDVSIVAKPTTIPVAPPAKPIKKVKEVREKYHWKDNNKKPEYDGNDWNHMIETLKPKMSPNKFPAGYVWTTKFSNVSFVVDIGYKGPCSTTKTKFWKDVYVCPPCLDANNYPFMHITNGYYVEYDEQGNKFWCEVYEGDFDDIPIQQAYKYVEGSSYKSKKGNTYVSRRSTYAYWQRDNNYTQ